MKMTRRDFLATTTATIGSYAFAYPAKSNLRSKNAFYEESQVVIPVASDYVQDGLVAMWDGIENVGLGEHDENATIWVDLTGHTQPSNLYGNAIWKNSALRPLNDGDNAGANFDPAFYCSQIKQSLEYTMEWVFDNTNGSWSGLRYGPQFYNGSSRFFSCPNDGWIGRNGTFQLGKEPMPQSLRFMIHYVACRGSESNGIITGDISENGAIGAQTSDNRNWFILSNLSPGSNKAPCYARGGLYCIRWYSRALTDEELAYNYQIDKVRFNLP